MTESETIRRFMAQNQNIASVPQVFDLALFLALNREYESKPVLATAREFDDASREVYAQQRGKLLDDRVGIRGKRILEVGCGAGDVCNEVARQYDASVVGVDITDYPTWDESRGENVEFLNGDLTDPSFLQQVAARGPFDRIYSLVVWEHVEHPFTLLEACHQLLRPHGRFYLRANLYRSAVASHLYRHVFFPWPHLLFGNEVFAEFFREQGLPEEIPAWLNKLTYAQYLLYFDQIGFDVQGTWLHKRPLDTDFYNRFYAQLAPYPRFDLELDFMNLILLRRPTGRLGLVKKAARRVDLRLQDLADDLRKRSAGR